MRTILCTFALIVLGAFKSAEAGFLIHSDGNDKKDDVIAAINTYNATHNPDLSTAIDQLSVKTDAGSGAFSTLDSAGFDFYRDALGTTAIISIATLHGENPAYMAYAGAANLMYYTVKAGNGFDLFLYDPGVINFLHSGPPGISHITFWSGPAGANAPAPAPEPASMSLLLLGLAGFIGGRRLRRPRITES